MSRRKLFGAAGVTAAVVGAAGAGALAGRVSAASTAFGGLDQPVPFRGERQAGIITSQQDRMHFAAFDVTTDKRDEVIAVVSCDRDEETALLAELMRKPISPKQARRAIHSIRSSR